ncbi:kinase-like protein [Rhizopogon salebrosus TDB-379]|nr:kinase-like protein [Rhizopogon salebrosus TDB-379]
MMQGHYTIASGGLGDVYRCTLKYDAGSVKVAVKSIRFPDLSEDRATKMYKSFDREIHVLARLKHPYVLPLHGTVEGLGPFRALISPWMPKGNLDSYLRHAGETLTAMDRLRMLKQITQGLEYLHDNGVIHGDLTSNNVLIAADGSPRIADFGISNIVMLSNAAFSHHTGAVRWTAPEIVVIPEDQTIIQYGTKSSDIYALGGIMLQVLYGKQPYWWLRSPIHVVSAKFRGVEPIRTSIKIEPNHLDFMRRCWLTDSTARPSVNDVLAFLQEHQVHFIQAGATRPSGDWRRNPYPGPSNDTLHHPNPSGRSPSSARQQYISPHLSSHGRAPPGRMIISSPSRANNYNTETIPTQPFLQLARNLFSNTQNSRVDEGIELQESHTEVVDVLPVRAVPRQYTARKVQRDRKQAKEEREAKKQKAREVREAEKQKAREVREAEKQKAREAREAEKQKARETKNAKNTKNAPGGSRLSESNVNPQPGEGAQTQPTPGSHSVGLSTSSTPATAAGSAVTMRWARFWSAACCISAQNTDDHH